LLLTGWKKTFVFDWRDYEKSFETLLESFDEHGKVLEKLSDEWEKQRTVENLVNLTEASEEMRRRVNDNVIQQNRLLSNSAETNHRLGSHVDQFTRFSQEVIRQYEQNRIEMFRLAEKEEERRKEEQKAAILAWLKTPGECQSTYHLMFCEVRKNFPDTAVWILNENKVFNWMYEEIPTHSVMWLNGKKGAGKRDIFLQVVDILTVYSGKTILASTIIQKCMEIPNFKTSYFYCREHDSSVNTAAAVLKGILRQLLMHNQGPLPTCIAKKSNSPEEVLVNIDTVKSLLELFCDSDMNQFIVIDGLDELKLVEVKPIVKFWITMADKCENYKPGKIRVLFVSQDGGDIRKLMQSGSADIFDLPPDRSTEDINRYILAQFDNLQEKFDLSDKDTHEARNKISARAEGKLRVSCYRPLPAYRNRNVSLRYPHHGKPIQAAYHSSFEGRAGLQEHSV
jgi:hypothetical protein